MNDQQPRSDLPQVNKPAARKSARESISDSEMRRRMTLALSITMLVVAIVAWWISTDSTGSFIAAACGRIGIVMGALWLAWPSLRRPAKWLPAGAAVIGVVALIAVAAQPRLILPAIPIVGAIVALSGFARAFRRKQQ